MRIEGPLRTDSGDAMLPAIRAGLGLAYLPGFIVDADLAAGTLEAVLGDWEMGAAALHLLTPARHPPPGSRRGADRVSHREPPPDVRRGALGAPIESLSVDSRTRIRRDSRLEAG